MALDPPPMPALPSISRLDLSDTQKPENQAGALNSGRVPLSARRLSKAVLHADSTDTSSSNAAGIVMLTDAVGTPRPVRVVQKEESKSKAQKKKKKILHCNPRSDFRNLYKSLE